MAVAPKIKHVDQRPNGVLRFRRRFPKDVAEHLGQPALQVHIRNTSGLAFHQEYQGILREFDRIVSQTRAALSGNDDRPPIERWHEALLKAEGLVEETTGLEDDPVFARHEIARGLAKRPGTDPLLIKALANPEAAPPKLTLGDAFNMYEKDREVSKSKKRMNDLKRVERRVREALGDIDKLPLEDLKKSTHRRKFRDFYVNLRRRDGTRIDPESMQREANTAVAVLNYARKNSDTMFEHQVFSGIEWPEPEKPKLDRRPPLALWS